MMDMKMSQTKLTVEILDANGFFFSSFPKEFL